MRLACVLAIAIGLSHSTLHAQPSDDPRVVRAFGVLYSSAQLGSLVKRWCDARAPETSAVTDTALAAWKRTHRLDEIETRAPRVLGDRVETLRAAVDARRNEVFGRLDKDSRAPAADCRDMLAYLNRSANPARLHPFETRLAYGALDAADRSAGTSATTLPPSTPTAPLILGGRGGRGALYTVAQLTTLIQQDERSAERRLKELGRITVQGTLEPYSTDKDATLWLNSLRPGWRSKRSVQCYDLSFRRLYDANVRDVAVRGVVREYDNWIVLEQCEAVRDVAGLTPSPIASADAYRRLEADRSRVCPVPDAGIAMEQLDGIYQPADLRYNPMTMLYDPDETTFVVLKDGWVYDNLRCSPHDIDIAVSRELEPQHWHRWRRQNGVLEVQEYDEHGRTNGRWTARKWIARPPVGPRRLSGAFHATASASTGVIGNGATSIASTTYTFRPDGRFRWSNFTQMFASSSSGTGQGGASGAVGGVTFGPDGTTATSVGGGEDEGTYTIVNYTLELRTRSGRVFRFPIFPWDQGKYRDYLVINGTTYSPR
ncbi:MAG: hypothetical protein MUF00_03530 [Gemmatimonadaceae bacterium]|jgi:hypothetical protein|nr:hypothetical protein [Gemmatimonadaceae bacterium]